MKVSYNWLKKIVDFDLSPYELAEKLTNVGLETEEVISTLPDFKGIIVGKVLSVDKHPNADKLSVCNVDIGEETFQVICGAPNVAKGQNIPFAPIGTTLPGGIKIKKAEIRGVESFGMICSESELGLSDNSDGIWVLPDDWKLGKEVYKILELNQDYIIDLAITPNRPDAMSMIGIAREVAAITSTEYKMPEINLDESDDMAEKLISVKIENPDGCPRYAARVIRNLKIGPSPSWIEESLKAGGVRPINNIVDVTNYVLLELGQPLHAFDLSEIKGNKIIVRDSFSGEKFVTLDGKERLLPENTVMICDAEKPVAIGGIMGGLNSEVSDKTVDVLLESAYFTPNRIAASSKKLGLSSEASQRFEKGVDPNGIIAACNRAAYLLAEAAGGTVMKGVVDNCQKQFKPKLVSFRPSRVNVLLGTNLKEDKIKGVFSKLEIEYKNGKAKIPTFRPDLEREVDLIEEVARMIGFENIPLREQSLIEYDAMPNKDESFNTDIKDKIRELGFSEVYSNSMLPANELESIDDPARIKLLNPISDDMDAMRPSLLPGLLKIVSYNINRSIPDLRIFEMGRVFFNKDEQPYFIAGMMHGNRILLDLEGAKSRIDFYDLKGFVEAYLSKISLDKYDLILYDNNKYFDQNQVIGVKKSKEIIGHFGRIKPEIVKQFDITTDVYGFEFSIKLLQEKVLQDKLYQPFSRFPYIEKDLAFVVEEKVAAGDIEKFIYKTGQPLLNFIEIFDVFKSKELGEDKKSIAFRFRFQSPERTLTDKEVGIIFLKIIKEVERKFHAKLRE